MTLSPLVDVHVAETRSQPVGTISVKDHGSSPGLVSPRMNVIEAGDPGPAGRRTKSLTPLPSLSA